MLAASHAALWWVTVNIDVVYFGIQMPNCLIKKHKTIITLKIDSVQ